jgi:hypothetical protein
MLKKNQKQTLNQRAKYIWNKKNLNEKIDKNCLILSISVSGTIQKVPVKIIGFWFGI